MQLFSVTIKVGSFFSGRMRSLLFDHAVPFHFFEPIVLSLSRLSEMPLGFTKNADSWPLPQES